MAFLIPIDAPVGVQQHEYSPARPSKGPLPHFPPELWAHVLAHVSHRSNLAACCQVSRFFCDESERLLYRTVTVRGVDFVLFTETITQGRPELGAHVEIFNVDVAVLPATHSLGLVLKKLSSLCELDLRVGWGVANSAHKLLRGCSFNLRRFSSDLILRKDLFAFLATQTNLREWKATPDGAERFPLVLPAGMLPNLTTLHLFGHRDLAFRASFSPHVTHLRLDLHFRALHPASEYEEREVTHICDIFGAQLVSFRLDQPYTMEFRRRLPPVVFYILSRAPVLRFLHVCEPLRDTDARACARSFVRAADAPPQPASRSLETLVWTSGAFLEGRTGPGGTPAASGSDLPFVVYDEGGRRVVAQTPRDVRRTVQNALKGLPALRRVVLMNRYQYVYDANGDHAPVSDGTWKGV